MPSRLSHVVEPYVYDIYLNTDLNNFTFTGETVIHCILNDNCNRFYLNSKGLLIEKISVTRLSYDYLDNFVQDGELLELITTEELNKGEICINIRYTKTYKVWQRRGGRVKGEFRAKLKTVCGIRYMH